MKIWAIWKDNGQEREIGIDVDGVDHETAINDLYCIARNLFTGDLELFWTDGEKGRADFH